MAGSIFKEVTITPHTFDLDNIFPNFKKRNEAKDLFKLGKISLEEFIKIYEEPNDELNTLVSFLRNLSVSGILIKTYSDWEEKFKILTKDYDDLSKEKLSAIIELLVKRNRIVAAQNKSGEQDDETFWIDKTIELNKTREFDLIVTLQNSSDTTQINHLNSNLFLYEGATVDSQSKENMKNLLAPVLAYAEIAKIIDPYFDPTKDRYEDALEIICQTLGYHHGITEPAIIDIHTSIDSIIYKKEKVKIFDWQKTKEWPSIIRKFEKKYGHKICVYMWEERETKKWHDRWIITNQCGISLGKGTDIGKWTDSTWGIMDWDKLTEVTSKFPIDKNREFYRYIGKIDSDSAIRERFPEDSTIKNVMSEDEEKEEQKKRQLELEKELKRREEERLAKKANVKSFKRN